MYEIVHSCTTHTYAGAMRVRVRMSVRDAIRATHTAGN